MTRGRRLYFPSEGRRAEDFFILKNPDGFGWVWTRELGYLKAACYPYTTEAAKMQRYRVYYVWKLLYMFQVVLPPIIRRACNCSYSIWYLSDRHCYLSLTAGSSNGVTNTRCCRYSCMRNWWWVEVPPETCRAVSTYNKLCNIASCWTYVGIWHWQARYHHTIQIN